LRKCPQEGILKTNREKNFEEVSLRRGLEDKPREEF
jgi:hypothetical protein